MTATARAWTPPPELRITPSTLATKIRRRIQGPRPVTRFRLRPGPKVRFTVEQRIANRHACDRRYSARNRTYRSPHAIACAVWLGARTPSRLAIAWGVTPRIARRLLERAEAEGFVARVGDGSWHANRPRSIT